MKLWSKYLLRELVKVFALFMLSFYFLYIVIDYCAHAQDFTQSSSLGFSHIVFYYLLQFIKRADILFPLALMIATIKVFGQLNQHRELVAFQAAGLSWKKLMQPLFCLSAAVVLINFAIAQFFLPSALTKIDQIYDTHLRHSARGERLEPIHVVHLENGGKLIYQYQDSAQQAFIDVILVQNPDLIYRMKTLKADPKEPIGTYVDELKRIEGGHFEKTLSYESYTFKDLTWDKDLPRRGFIPFENRSLTELVKLSKNHSEKSKYAAAEVKTQLYFKSAMPLLALLAPLSVAPYCIRYNRNLKVFLIYVIALPCYVTFVALMDAAVIIGENNTLNPATAIFIPFLMISGWTAWKYR